MELAVIKSGQYVKGIQPGAVAEVIFVEQITEEIPEIQTWLDGGDTGVISGYILPLFQIPTELITETPATCISTFHLTPKFFGRKASKQGVDCMVISTNPKPPQKIQPTHLCNALFL